MKVFQVQNVRVTEKWETEKWDRSVPIQSLTLLDKISAKLQKQRCDNTVNRLRYVNICLFLVYGSYILTSITTRASE